MESELLRAILLRYGRDPRIKLWRNNTGFDLDRKVRYGLKGSADILGILQGGRFIGIEVKSPTGRQSEQQQRFQRMVEGQGGLYVLARSVEDVERALLQVFMPPVRAVVP